MNRRQMFRSLLGTPLAAAAAVSSVSGAELVLRTEDIRLDLRVCASADGKIFALTLLAQPWPTVGARIRIEHRTMRLRAIVEETVTEAILGTDRFWCHVSGRVLAFEALAPLDPAPEIIVRVQQQPFIDPAELARVVDRHFMDALRRGKV